jgi:hypothetical protein
VHRPTLRRPDGPVPRRRHLVLTCFLRRSYTALRRDGLNLLVRSRHANHRPPRRPRRIVLLAACGLIAIWALLAGCSSGDSGAGILESVTVTSARSQGSAPTSAGAPATGPGSAPVPTTTRGAVTAPSDRALTAIVVDSNPSQYFVLFVRPDPAGAVEVPVAIVRGRPGTTTLTDDRTQLPMEHYRVATSPSTSPVTWTVTASTISPSSPTR